MTLNEMRESLKHKNPEAPLVFSTMAETIGAGYHVTELKASEITSIDCAGNVSRWTETALQLLDGEGREYMKVGKFLGILNHSLATIESLKASRTFVEFSPNNEGLRKFEPVLQETSSEIAEFRLIDVRAQCKPSLSGSSVRSGDKQPPSAAVGCCGGPAPKSVGSCCAKDPDAKTKGQAGCGCSDTKSGRNGVSAECH